MDKVHGNESTQGSIEIDSNTELKCKICEKNFLTWEDVTSHISQHLDNDKCEVCGKEFENKLLLRKHLVTHFSKPKSRFHCPVVDCVKDFKCEISLKHHLMKHNGNFPYKCEICEKSYTNASSLQKHTEAHLKLNRFNCNICGYRASNRSNLEQHMRTHTHIRPFKCDICGKAFCQKPNLTRHSRTHTGERPYKCKLCGKCFIESGKLTKHYRVHAGCKNYQCTVCGKTFAEKRNLTQHLLIHSGEKPHKCSICDRAFRYISDLREHKLVHSDEKAFLCATCGHGFKSNRNLKKHVRTLHGDSGDHRMLAMVATDVSMKNHCDTPSVQLAPVNSTCITTKSIGSCKIDTNVSGMPQELLEQNITTGMPQELHEQNITSEHVSGAVLPETCVQANVSSTSYQLTSSHCQIQACIPKSVPATVYDTFMYPYHMHHNATMPSNNTATIVHPQQPQIFHECTSVYTNINCGPIEMKDNTLGDIQMSPLDSKYSQILMPPTFSYPLQVCTSTNNTMILSNTDQVCTSANNTMILSNTDQIINDSVQDSWNNTSSIYSSQLSTNDLTPTHQANNLPRVYDSDIAYTLNVHNHGNHSDTSKQANIPTCGLFNIPSSSSSSSSDNHSADALTSYNNDLLYSQKDTFCPKEHTSVKIGTLKEICDPKAISFNDEEASSALLLLCGYQKDVPNEITQNLQVGCKTVCPEALASSDAQGKFTTIDSLSESDIPVDTESMNDMGCDPILKCDPSDMKFVNHNNNNTAPSYPLVPSIHSDPKVSLEALHTQFDLSHGHNKHSHCKIPVKPLLKPNCHSINLETSKPISKTVTTKMSLRSKLTISTVQNKLFSKVKRNFLCSRKASSKAPIRTKSKVVITEKISPVPTSHGLQSLKAQKHSENNLIGVFLEEVEKKQNSSVKEDRDSLIKGRIQCLLCHSYFQHNGAYTQHLRTHKDNDLIQCEVCSKIFCRKSNLKQHMKIHKGQKDFHCDICGQNFMLCHSLISHQKVHFDARPYKCDVCGSCFKFQRDLINHNRIHSGSKPYQCSECGKTFSLNSSLNRHFRVHNGALPYTCDICGQKFSQNGNMHQHIRKRHVGTIRTTTESDYT